MAKMMPYKFKLGLCFVVIRIWLRQTKPMVFIIVALLKVVVRPIGVNFCVICNWSLMKNCLIGIHTTYTKSVKGNISCDEKCTPVQITRVTLTPFMVTELKQWGSEMQGNTENAGSEASKTRTSLVNHKVYVYNVVRHRIISDFPYLMFIFIPNVIY